MEKFYKQIGQYNLYIDERNSWLFIKYDQDAKAFVTYFYKEDGPLLGGIRYVTEQLTVPSQSNAREQSLQKLLNLLNELSELDQQ